MTLVKIPNPQSHSPDSVIISYNDLGWDRAAPLLTLRDACAVMKDKDISEISLDFETKSMTLSFKIKR